MTRAAGGADPDPCRRLLDGVTFGLALLDPGALILTANGAAETLLGHGRGALAGRPLQELYTPEDGQSGASERALEAARADGRWEADEWVLRADGTRVRMSLALVALAGGKDGYILEVREGGAASEVEARLRARLAREEEARRRAEDESRARDEFLATLSHELRTPLTAIMGWAHLLRTGNLDEPSRARALETIERNAHLEAQLTADILDVARIITGKLRLEVQKLDPARVIEAAIENVRQDASARHVALEFAAEGTPGFVSADPDRLQQVVGNLLTNAFKFTPEGGRVQVHLRERDGEVEIGVQDSGEGISPEMLPHVFERFRQGSGHARGKGGLGLGLAIVHHIVELHGGHVHASSEGPGRGSTFTVLLPSLAGRAASAPEEPDGASASPPPLHDLTVLVVDDQADARELMCAVLGRCGARVVAVDSTAAALQALDECRPDVILSDLEMPGEDGYTLIRKVRERPPEKGGSVPAAALTAYARTEDRLHSLRAGFHRHVPKPVQPDELAEIVASLARRRP
jgi:PAS domain S-box-containing protein